jgi:hypothetical protein
MMALVFAEQSNIIPSPVLNAEQHSAFAYECQASHWIEFWIHAPIAAKG